LTNAAYGGLQPAPASRLRGANPHLLRRLLRHTKVRTPYEFGVKVSVATTLKEGLIVGMRAMPGNPWDGHTLEQAIEQVSALAQQKPKTVIVDKGYKGVTVEGIQILRSGQRRGITRALKAMIKRRSAIEPTIGHMKSDGRLGRNPLKGG
jgi:IS5 family transposase